MPWRGRTRPSCWPLQMCVREGRADVREGGQGRGASRGGGGGGGHRRRGRAALRRMCTLRTPPAAALRAPAHLPPAQSSRRPVPQRLPWRGRTRPSCWPLQMCVREGREAGWWGDAWATASNRSFRQVTALQHSPRLRTCVVAVDALHREAPVGRLGGRCQDALLVSPRPHRRWEVGNPEWQEGRESTGGGLVNGAGPAG